MSWLNGARARMALLFSRRAAESRMDEEVRFHIEMETERLVREEHLSKDEARRRALVTFGGVTQHTETLREGRGLAWLGGLSLDIKLAGRMLRKNPGLTFVAVIGMAVAVTIGAVMFSAVSAIIDSKLPFAEGERVVAIRNVDTRGLNDARATHLHDLATWREALTTVSELGAYRQVSRNLIAGDGHTEPFRIAEMSASGFRIARTPPMMGRYLNDDDERPGAAFVVVIGQDVWQNRFSGRADIIGHQIELGDVRHTIVGVMPAAFRFPVNNTMWTPLRLNTSSYQRGHAPAIDVFANMKAEATIDDVRNQLLTIGQRLNAEYPQTHAQLRPRVVPYTRMFIDNPEAAWTYHLVQLLVSLLLVVIGTNVAILVYARTASRMGEIAVRTALGASRSRIVAQLFAEALAMSLIAAGVGLVIAHFVLVDANTTISRIQGGRLPAWQHFHITAGVIVYSIVLAVVAAVIVGVVPALKATG
jgi:cell division protein FtsX